MHATFFFAGAFLCNAVPHLTAGLRGEVFPTPFARPTGKGPSSPLVNVYWGLFNLLLGVVLLSQYPLTIGLNADCAALVAGVLAIGSFTAHHFGKVRRDTALLPSGCLADD
jgi:hypothetical protein